MNNGLLATPQKRGVPPLQLAPKELAFASSIIQQATITTVTDLTGLSISFNVVQFPVEVLLWVPYMAANTASLSGAVDITDAANTVMAYGLWGLFASGAFGNAYAIERITTPGAYSRKGRIERIGGSGSVTVNGNLANSISYIMAREVRR